MRDSGKSKDAILTRAEMVNKLIIADFDPSGRKEIHI